jgi:transcriptional regulator with GAF, ATPase, and Fis domain
VTRSSDTDRDVWVEFARAISAQPSVADALQAFTATAITHISGADAAGMTVLDRNQFATTAATDDLPAAVDVLQYEFGGPCVQAILDPATHVCVEDLHTESRWPEFAKAAVEQTPVRSMLSCRLDLEGDVPFGSLNLYATQPHAFDDTAVSTCEHLAGHAALAIALVAEREQIANLQTALQSSRTIGIAMGVLMTRRLITSEQAFDLLRTASQHTHRKLRDIATDVAETGTLNLIGSNKTRHTHTTLHHTDADLAAQAIAQ